MTGDALSSTFAALADPTRRAILARLAAGETTVTALAEPFTMSLPGVSKHLKVLERAGLITRGRHAQWRPCRLDAGPLREVDAWLDRYRRFWTESFDRLDDHLATVEEKDKFMSANEGAGNAATGKAEHELVITRVFDRPRAVVFRAWTNPEQVTQWWGPHGFTNPVCQLDVRPGGAIRIHMRGPDGTVYPMTGRYLEVVEAERLVFMSAALDGDGNPLFEVLNTVTFSERDGQTTMTYRAAIVTSTAAAPPFLAGMEIGWTQSLERLGAHLAAV